jgi:hypothetical protein
MASKVWALVLLGLLALVSHGSTAAIPSSSTSTTTEKPYSIHSPPKDTGVMEEWAKEKDPLFYACCKENDIFQSEEDAKHACTYANQASFGAMESLSPQKQSALLKCYGGSQDNTCCCSNAGVRWALLLCQMLDSVQ